MIDPELSRASTLPSSYYTGSAVLEEENRRIFARTWQLAGHARQVASRGDYFTAVVGDEPVLIVKGADGEVRAMSNVCRHRAGPVARGSGTRPVLQCGYHGWTYGLDGRLAVTPEFDGVENFDRASCRLPLFQTGIWNDLLFVNLDAAAPALTDFLEGMTEDMPRHDYSTFRLAERKVWELDCNWKVYVDNYLEGYHIPMIHPGLFRELDYAKYRTDTRKNYSIQIAPTRRPERIRTAHGDEQVRYFWIFPNLMLNVYPDNFSTNLIVPIGEGRTATIFEWYFPESEGVRKQIEETVAFSDEIQVEDIAICEAVQRGLRSATYDAGRFSPQRENGVHHFHRLYAEAMGLV